MITNTGMYWLFVKYKAFSIKDGGGLAATAKFINSAEEASIASSSPLPLLRQGYPEKYFPDFSKVRGWNERAQ